MKRILFLLFLACIFVSCSKKYQYIEVIDSYNVFGKNPVEKEKEPVVIEAETDSAAYLTAFRNYCIAVKVNAQVSEHSGVKTDVPKSFKLLNPEGSNITYSVVLTNKRAREKEIIELVVSMDEMAADSNPLPKMSSQELEKLVYRSLFY